MKGGVDAKLFICVCSAFTAPCHLCFLAPSPGEMIHAYGGGGGGSVAYWAADDSDRSWRTARGGACITFLRERSPPGGPRAGFPLAAPSRRGASLGQMDGLRQCQRGDGWLALPASPGSGIWILSSDGS